MLHDRAVLCCRISICPVLYKGRLYISRLATIRYGHMTLLATLEIADCY